MRFLQRTNTALLSFSLAVLGGELRHFSPYPSLFYTGLAITFIVLVMGVLPYRVRVKNPLALEFLIIFCSLILGCILWF